MDYNILEQNVRNKLKSVIWSNKIQEKQADIYSSAYKALDTINTLAISLTSVGILSLFFTNCFTLKMISASVAFVSLFLCIYLKSYNYENRAKQNKEAAKALLVVRDSLEMLLIEIQMKKGKVEDNYCEYRAILKDLEDIYNLAPTTTKCAVRLAEKDINGDQILREFLK